MNEWTIISGTIAHRESLECYGNVKSADGSDSVKPETEKLWQID